MKPNDKPQFLALLQTIAKYFRQPLSDDVSYLYWHTLQDLPWEQVKQALLLHLKNPGSGKWMPKAADILEQVQSEAQQHAQQQTAIAWEKVEQAIPRAGIYSDVAFDDPRIHIAVKKMGGWQKLCSILIQDMPLFRQRFDALYRQALQEEVPAEYPVI